MNPYENRVSITNVSERMERLISLSEKRLKEIGPIADKEDVRLAMLEKDELGQPTVSVTLTEEVIDTSTYEKLREVVKVSTLHATVDYEVFANAKGEFASIMLIFDNPDDEDKLAFLRLLETWGHNSNTIKDGEAVYLQLMCVPLLLGGKYAFTCVDPIFYCQQPSDPSGHDNNQIKILFETPDTCFPVNEGFDARKVAGEIRSELISSVWEDETIAAINEQNAAFEKEQTEKKEKRRKEKPQHTFRNHN